MPFVGYVEDGRFLFHRAIRGSRGFKLIVAGRIVNGSGGAELHMVLRLGLAIAIFQFAALSALIGTVTIGGMNAIVSAVLAVAVLGLTVGFFVHERRRTLEVLEESFPGAILCKDSGR